MISTSGWQAPHDTNEYKCGACFDVEDPTALAAGETGVAFCGNSTMNEGGVEPEFYGAVEATSASAFKKSEENGWDGEYFY